jgi:hypothetical protein
MTLQTGIAMSASANWYPDPTDVTQARWWDGTAWTSRVAPIEQTSPAAVDTEAEAVSAPESVEEDVSTREGAEVLAEPESAAQGEPERIPSVPEDDISFEVEPDEVVDEVAAIEVPAPRTVDEIPQSVIEQGIPAHLALAQDADRTAVKMAKKHQALRDRELMVPMFPTTGKLRSKSEQFRGIAEQANRLLDELEAASTDLNAVQERLGLSYDIENLRAEVAHRQESIDRYLREGAEVGSFIEMRINVQGLTKQIRDLDREIVRKEGEFNHFVAAIEGIHEWHEVDRAVKSKQLKLRSIESLLDEKTLYVESGLIDYEHPAENSVALKAKLETLKEKIKQVVKDKKATTCTPMVFNNSSEEGLKFTRSIEKLALNMFNTEAMNLTKSTRGNPEPSIKKLRATADKIQTFGKMLDLRIASRYITLREQEIKLAAQYRMALDAERDAERERKELIREQAKVEAEIKVQKDKLAKEESHYRNVLGRLEKELADARREHQDMQAIIDKQREVEEAQGKLEEVGSEIKKTDFRAANTRAGYVYVISNIGAFGERVVKIGMTRRLDPMERVLELGDASVPFRFDVHTIVFSDDAVALEGLLHDAFAKDRVNKVNQRKEFFYTSPSDVLEVLKRHKVNVFDFVEKPVAEEYRKSVTGE